MAISTQQFKISSIGTPILKSACPIVLSVLWPLLAIAVYVMNIKNANIVIATAGTFSTQPLNEFLLALPIAALLVEFIPILVPKLLLAFWRAKFGFCRITAKGAFSSMAPSVSVIALPATKQSLSVLNTVGSRFKLFMAVLTDCSNTRSFSHRGILTHSLDIVNTIYFEIAVKRIEAALAQGRLL